MLAQSFPAHTPQFMAYLASIVQCHHRFKGLSWVFYDTACRRRAAKQKDLNWPVMDPSLFNSIFTGKAKATNRCIHCLSEEHTTEHCPSAYGPLLQLTRNASVNLAASLCSKPTPSYQAQPSYPTTTKVCGLFNSNAGPRCTYGKTASLATHANFVVTFILRQTAQPGPPMVENAPSHSRSSLPSISSCSLARTQTLSYPTSISISPITPIHNIPSITQFISFMYL